MARTWPIAIGIYLIMLPATAVVPVLFGLTEGRFPGLSDLERHLFMSINLAGALLAALVSGLLSDRLGQRRRLIVPALFVFAAAMLAMYLPWSYPLQLLLRFIEGAAHMTVLTLGMTLAADGVPPQRRGRTMGLVGAAMSLGVASGAALGGRLGSPEPTLVLVWMGGLMLVLALFAQRFLRDAPIERLSGRVSEMLRLIARRHELLVPYTFTFIDRVTVGFIISTVSLYFATELGFDSVRIGLVMAAFLLPYGLLTFPVGLLCERLDAGLIMALGSLLYGLFIVALGLVSADGVLTVMVAGGLVASLMLSPSLILVTRLAGPNQQATAMGGFHLIGSLGFMLGPLFGVGTVQALTALGYAPYPGVFIASGALEILCALLFLPWLMRIRRRAAAAAR